MNTKGIALSELVQGAAPRRRPPFFRTKKIAIIGNTGSHAHAPYFDRDWTIIAHPCCKKHLPTPPDWWVDMHGPQNFRKGKSWSPAYYQWLKHLKEPIFMQEDWPDVPQAIRYPKERILAEWRDYPYFTNHCAWMAALGLSEGITHFGLFGCEYKHELERGKQRESLIHWLGILRGRGVKLVLPNSSSLLSEPKELYGYESHDAEGNLKASYLPPKKAEAKPPGAPPAPGEVGFTILDPAVERPTLAQIPDEEPAWERWDQLRQRAEVAA